MASGRYDVVGWTGEEEGVGIFERFEKKVEGAVNGVFARAFKGDVQPVEIAARLQRELDAEAKLMSRDKRLVPNEFVVGLSQHDHDKLAPYSKTLIDRAGRRAASPRPRHGLRVQRPDPDPLRAGRRAARPAASPSPPRPSPGSSERDTARPSDDRASTAARLVLEVNGTRHPLHPPGLVIGRGTDADLRINDPGHLPAARRDPGPRPTARPSQIDIVDLGSTNGIIVNGQQVRQAV